MVIVGHGLMYRLLLGTLVHTPAQCLWQVWPLRVGGSTLTLFGQELSKCGPCPPSCPGAPISVTTCMSRCNSHLPFCVVSYPISFVVASVHVILLFIFIMLYTFHPPIYPLVALSIPSCINSYIPGIGSHSASPHIGPIPLGWLDAPACMSMCIHTS